MLNHKKYNNIIVRRKLNENIIADNMRKDITDFNDIIIPIFKKRLSNGIVKFSFKKVNGDIRNANGTTNIDLIKGLSDDPKNYEYVSSGELKKVKNDQVCFFDTDKKAWRSCKSSNLIEILDETPEYEAKKMLDIPEEVNNTINNTIQQDMPEPKVFVIPDNEVLETPEDPHIDIINNGEVSKPAINDIVDNDSNDDNNEVIVEIGENKVYDELMRFTFRLYTKYDPDDGFWAWTAAYSSAEAADYMLGEYWGLTRASLYTIEPMDETADDSTSLQDYCNVDPKTESDTAFASTDANTVETAQTNVDNLTDDYTVYDFSKNLDNANATPEALKRLLNTGVVHFSFTKVNGDVREAYGTTCLDLIGTEFQPKGGLTKNGNPRNFSKDTIRFFDIIAKGWRSCRIANIL